MGKFWDSIFGLNYELSIWVEEEDLGREIFLFHKNKRWAVKIPQTINKEITLRLRGFGKTRMRKTGDLLLHAWLNRGEDLNKNLWLSETSARNGTEKRLFAGENAIMMEVPSKSHNGLTIRLKGFGREPSFNPRAPYLDQKKKGDLLVKLFVYPDSITPVYGSFDALSTENMALEGWVYRKFDDVICKIGRSSIPAHPVQADLIADQFNEKGWKSIFKTMVDHLNLTHLSIGLTTSSSNISLPGSCERAPLVVNNTVQGYQYKITINEQFLDNPFSIAAILAHELCHIVYSEKIEDSPKSAGSASKTEKNTLEEERTVDLLVFIFKMGEFQLRVARDKRLTLGYFNQEIFERIQVIVSRKLNSI
jgi:hypothetical protein